MIAIAQPLLGTEEEIAIFRVLASGHVAQGRYVATFEQHFAALCQVQDAIAVSSGTAALHLALLAHDIGPGDEVITTAFALPPPLTLFCMSVPLLFLLISNQIPIRLTLFKWKKLLLAARRQLFPYTSTVIHVTCTI